MSKETMRQFYQAFQRHDGIAMAGLYHEDAVFNDPVFRNLNAKEARAMWQMLLDRSKGQLDIEFHSLIGDMNLAQCTWEARYKFTKTERDVHNIIHSTMEFKEGLIISHRDEFHFWRWSSMALGTPGMLLGWTPLLKNKVRKMAINSLKHYMNR